ncbi:MAG: YbgC/FadM family acyl-CoA thioesterase [Candidatus Aminicenantes bacterium]|nr:YbgC/FadM family acyl-CoA thioesterase [Candidatus Aminicenantes bacterium]
MKSPNSENLSKAESSPSKKTSYVETRERVRYSETDQMGVAHNKHYFEWFELGRTEFCRKKGISYKEIEKKGFFLVVAESFCKYKKPLRYDDEISIQVFLREATPKKFIFEYKIISLPKNQVAAQGYTVHVPTDKKACVTALPKEIFNKIKNL